MLEFLSDLEWNYEVLIRAILFGAAAGLLTFYWLLKSNDRYPSGPFAFPIIGNIPQILAAGNLVNYLERNRRRFGNVFTMTAGGNKRVVVSGYENLHKILVKNADYSSNRQTNSFPDHRQEVLRKTPGVFWAKHPHWKTIRSFSLSTLKDEGMGKGSMEPQIMEEVDKYITHYIQPYLGSQISLKNSLPQAMCNIISQMLFSRRFEYDDETFNKMIDAINISVELSNKISMVNGIPFNWLLVGDIVDKQRQLGNQLITPTITKYFHECRENMDPNDPQGVMQKFATHKPTNDEANNFADENAALVGEHLYVAGTETTSTALKWSLLFMCLHPEMQKKVQQEIDEQIGRDRAATYKDHLNMPYTDAVLLEVLRRSNIVPTSLPHTLEKDMVIDGKLIPAGSDLLSNMASVFLDETVFEEPMKFNPERFLTGDVAMKKQRVIPFGIGRRACLGESLARMEFFLFFVTFIQRYNVCLSEDGIATEEGNGGFINAPQDYKIIFSER